MGRVYKEMMIVAYLNITKGFCKYFVDKKFDVICYVLNQISHYVLMERLKDASIFARYIFLKKWLNSLVTYMIIKTILYLSLLKVAFLKTSSIQQES